MMDRPTRDTLAVLIAYGIPAALIALVVALFRWTGRHRT